MLLLLKVIYINVKILRSHMPVILQPQQHKLLNSRIAHTLAPRSPMSSFITAKTGIESSNGLTLPLSKKALRNGESLPSIYRMFLGVSPPVM